MNEPLGAEIRFDLHRRNNIVPNVNLAGTKRGDEDPKLSFVTTTKIFVVEHPLIET